MEKVCLVLENGLVLNGSGYAAKAENWKESIAEVVFNTGMSGYQEIITDPSYQGQLLVMTYPLQGNYGVNALDIESIRPAVKGFAAAEISEIGGSWRQESLLEGYLKKWDVPFITNIDTRQITKIVRDSKSCRGVILEKDSFDLEKVIEALKEFNYALDCSAVPMGVSSIVRIPSLKIDHESFSNDATFPNEEKYCAYDAKIGLLDFGVKGNIVEELRRRGCEIVIFPECVSPEEILAENLDGLVLSNGPGDPETQHSAIKTIKALLGKLPMFGICLGHQIIALSIGCDTYKMPFGHRGGNHPVKDIRNGKCVITSQNHGFAVDPKSVEEIEGLEITHINLNDGTIEGIKHAGLGISSVQYHPEASPGPRDSMYLFDEFLERVVGKCH